MDDIKNTHQEIQDYVLAVCGPLCEYPEQLNISTTNDERGVLIKLFAHQTDIGRLIGKKGDTVNSIRLLLRAIGTKNDARYSLKVDSLEKM